MCVEYEIPSVCLTVWLWIELKLLYYYLYMHVSHSILWYWVTHMTSNCTSTAYWITLSLQVTSPTLVTSDGMHILCICWVATILGVGHFSRISSCSTLAKTMNTNVAMTGGQSRFHWKRKLETVCLISINIVVCTLFVTPTILYALPPLTLARSTTVSEIQFNHNQ